MYSKDSCFSNPKSLDSRAPRSLCVVHCLCRARPYTATIRANTLPSHFSPLSIYISAPLVHPIQQTRLQSWSLACTQAKRESQAFKLPIEHKRISSTSLQASIDHNRIFNRATGSREKGEEIEASKREDEETVPVDICQ